MTLIQIITNFPKVKEESRRQTLEIGASINHVSPEKLFELLASAHLRVNIHFTQYADLITIFERDDKYMEKL